MRFPLLHPAFRAFRDAAEIAEDYDDRQQGEGSPSDGLRRIAALVKGPAR